MNAGHIQGGAPGVAAFGKLPWAPDFLTAGHLPNEASLLDWLEQGIAQGADRGEAWRSSFVNGSQTGFLRVASSNSLLCGVIAPSQDEVGRRFPFVVYSELDAEPLRVAPHAAPLALGTFLQDAGTFISQVSEERSDLTERIRSISRPDLVSMQSHLDGYTAWASSATIRTAGQAIFGAEWRQGFNFALYVAIESIRPFYGQENPPTRLAVRFPVGAGFAGAAALWMQIVRLCAGWSRTIPHCFWSFNPDCSWVTIFFGDLAPGAFADLWERDPENDTLSNLLRAQYPEQDLLRQLRPDLSELLGREGATVQQLLLQLPGSPSRPA